MSWKFEWFPPGSDITTDTPFWMNDVDNGFNVRFPLIRGISGPPYDPVNQPVPFEPGSKLKFINVEDAEVDITMIIKAESHEALWDKIRPLPRLFNPMLGEGAPGQFWKPGILRITTPATIWSPRILYCTCVSGFKINEDTLLEKSVEADLIFHANDPFWYSNTLHISTIPGALFSNVPWFSEPPVLPTGSGQAKATTTINNAGDAISSNFQIVIGGPGSRVRLFNRSLPTGSIQQFELIRNIDGTNNPGLVLGPNDRADVDFALKTVTKNGNNAIFHVAINSRFWPLMPGDNNIEVLADPVNVNFFINFSWRDAYTNLY